MGRYNIRESLRKNSPAINPVFSRDCGEFNNKIYEMMFEYACTCSNDMMNHYNKVGVQKWSDLIAYGISRDEFNTVEIDEIVNVILYAYQGIRMWSRIVKMSPVVFDSITNYIRKQLVKE